ncbi:hypothetical protein Mal4_36350 [Maioricimonas rarisocia]|uniref:YHS domain protein n=1 Tax=Maioricimonas rarisocia TaxID=2528026 RepID=A0A517Z9Y4_9PLAN|nr:hypothetical protein [Maioricimonas rarisocia]QDU39296.1 hypothetical protein Mal4_36350 [Maioricimonas rarisocia]
MQVDVRLPEVACIALLLALIAGCGGGATDEPAESAGPSTAGAVSVSQPSNEPTAQAPSQAAPAPAAIPTISLGGGSSSSAPTTSTTTTSPAASRQELLDRMMPLQVMLGNWRGITQREAGDFKGLGDLNWVWDFQTDRNQPAMVMSSEEGPYFRELRLTYLTDMDAFRLTALDDEGTQRTFDGTFSEPVEEFQGDDRRLHRRYRLEFTETEPADPKNAWKIVFDQQDNNRYLLEMHRRRGSRFQRFDTVGTQRKGTSFALNDEDYGEKECIISGGLGTIQVSYEGKSYWVCCTGCKAAFEEDPATWIAEYKAKQEMP